MCYENSKEKHLDTQIRMEGILLGSVKHDMLSQLYAWGYLDALDGKSAFSPQGGEASEAYMMGYNDAKGDKADV